MRLSYSGLIAIVLCACDPKPDSDTEPAEELIEGQVPDTVVPATDADSDGYAEEDDCDDSNADIHPGQPESCNGVDENCNGLVDEGFTDTDVDGTADCVDTEECDGLDNDGDGLLDEDFADADNDGTADCIDEELCNGEDDDGDGLIDEDFDADGDGFSPCALDDTQDCDDTDAAISPSAEEIEEDSIDNDCDGAIDEGQWAEGDLVITEIFNNPTDVSDVNGEWFEVHNVSGEARLLNGIWISDGLSEAHQIFSEQLLWMPADGIAIFGINADVGTNGGISLDYTYNNISLSNESDRILLEVDGMVLDDVSWDDGASMPDVSGSSMSLDPEFTDASKNDLAGVWCDVAWPDVGSAEILSSPRAPNPWCATVDHDGDGYAVADGDCDDEQADIGPGRPEVPYDALDNDCDPGTPDDDLDGDGALLANDCDDNDASVFPGNEEVCDGLDNDCDEAIDDADDGVTGARSWYPDVDEDGFGDSSADPEISCDALSGQVENSQDCDDTDATYNPGAIEDDCNDPEDYNCDGEPAFVDEDLDGFSACSDDCDDLDAEIFPYAWEDLSDSIDNDCDGETDSDDTDTVRYLSLGDDDYAIFAMSTVFPFCSTDWTSGYVSSNGRITFGAGSTVYNFSSAALAADVTLAGVWKDLNPSNSGRIAVTQYSDATGVYFINVPEYGSSRTVTFSMIMMDDGRVVLSYGDVEVVDGLAGWSCGSSGSATETDLTDDAADVPSSAAGIGQGTEESVHEVFSSRTDSNDLEGQTFTFCVGLGADLDGDGWSDECGDVDDTDASVTP